MIFYFTTEAEIVFDIEKYLNNITPTMWTKSNATFKWRCDTFEVTKRMITHPSRKKVKEIFDWIEKNDMKLSERKKLEFITKAEWQIFPIIKETFFKISFEKPSDAVLFKLRWA